MKTPRKFSLSERRVAQTIYHVELSRGSSIIASTLSRETGETALREILSTFMGAHGPGDIKLFTELLQERLNQRGRPDLASELFQPRELTTADLPQKSEARLVQHKAASTRSAS
ncbi:hypothetical protein GCM10027093_39440 [Paraburkholderia jirisanensis]